jgi:hypothetical protein
MFLALSAIKLVCEIAVLALMGQGLLHVLAGGRHETNFFYQLLRGIASPFTWAARRITPRRVADRHVPFVALFLLSIGWVVVTIEKIRYCVGVEMVGCR